MVVYRKCSFLKISELEKALSKPASEKAPVYANVSCLQKARWALVLILCFPVIHTSPLNRKMSENVQLFWERHFQY